MSEDRRFCENCGTTVWETTNFCPNCGAAQRPNPEVPTGPPPPTPEAGRIRTPYASDVPPAPREQRRRRGRAIPTLIIALVCLIVLIILARLVGGGGGGSTEGSKQASARTFTSENYAELATDPGSFRGASVNVEGRLLRNPEVKGSETSFQMFADPKNSEWNTIVHTDSAPGGLSQGDTVAVTGTVKGARTGENAFGGTVKAVEVDADSVELTKSRAR